MQVDTAEDESLTQPPPDEGVRDDEECICAVYRNIRTCTRPSFCHAMQCGICVFILGMVALVTGSAFARF
jgi:hypothetical protein